MGSSIAHIHNIARELELTIPHPIAINDYTPNEFNSVLVDNAEYVLQHLLKTKIECVTIDDESLV